ncbi:predicted protein [Nematostella vectensis]|uniref:Uncharacterized protein n=1 Tax=Nematostella vectensis TaxID=45351 RepID=A7RV99_NEMVE|nr:predicted protein [Nematostella vectensis]|eukprot:XP_001636597.1 predicted protein [Nematostella vectensis]
MQSELVLHEAAATGSYQDLQPMLMMGRIDPNFKDEDFGDRTALHWAASRAFVDRISLLGLTKELKNSVQVFFGKVVLSTSLPGFHLPFKTGLRCGQLHELFLHEVCALGDAGKLEELGSFVRKSKLDVNIRDEDWKNKTALHWAAGKGIHIGEGLGLPRTRQRAAAGERDRRGDKLSTHRIE